MTYFAKLFSLTFAARILVFLLSGIMAVVISRALGPEGWGAYSTLATLAASLALAAGLGVEASNVYVIGRDLFRRAEVVGTTLVVGLVTGSLAAGLFAAVNGVAGFFWIRGLDYVWIALGLATVPLLVSTNHFIYLLQGFQAFVEFNLADVARSAALLALIGAGLVLWRNVEGALAAYVVVSVIMLPVAIYLVLRRDPSAEGLSLSGSYLRAAVRLGLRAYLAVLFSNLMLRLDILLVNYYLGNRAVGLYALAVALASIIAFVPSAATTLHFPIVAGMRERAAAVGFTEQVCRQNLLLSILVASAVAGVAWMGLGPVFGSEFAPSFPLLLLLLPGMLSFSFSAVFTSFFYGTGFSWVVTVAPFCGLVVNTVLDVFLLPRWGLWVAPFASTVAYGVNTVILLFWFTRQTGLPLGNLLSLRRAGVQIYARLMPWLRSQHFFRAG